MRFIAILLVLLALMGAASAASSDVAGVYNNTIDTSTAPGGHVTKVWVLY